MGLAILGDSDLLTQPTIPEHPSHCHIQGLVALVAVMHEQRNAQECSLLSSRITPMRLGMMIFAVLTSNLI
jgi:hypothetical protein